MQHILHRAGLFNIRFRSHDSAVGGQATGNCLDQITEASSPGCLTLRAGVCLHGLPFAPGIQYAKYVG